MSEYPSLEKTNWAATADRITSEMRDYLAAYRTPVFEDLGTHCAGWGSGAYLRLGNSVFVLTNEHVAVAREQGRRLLHQLAGQEDWTRIGGDDAKLDFPFDLALMPVDTQAWNDSSNLSRAIEIDQIALAHAPVSNELFAFTGFAGENARFYFDTMRYGGTCSVAREVALPSDDERFDGRYHFGLDYKPNLATNVTPSGGLPMPPGLSGSTVWNTGYVEATMNGWQWTPELARVTGVLWGWPSNFGCIVATRAEYLRSFLLDVAATFNTGTLTVPTNSPK
ncbi:hypothetical protein [Mesorhizobium opportunistum]|nr:hypothetical protein [Mesorhizobium opportunistum]